MSLALFAMIQELKTEVAALTARVAALEPKKSSDAVHSALLTGLDAQARARELSKPEPKPEPRPTLGLSKRA